MNLINAKHRNDPELKAYTHVSDQFGPFATQDIPATVSEAPYILEGLLMTRRVKKSGSNMWIRAASRITFLL
jgi:TnpA family transposase